MFDAIEAINDIIDDINDDAAEYAESCYEEIYDELCYRVECGDLTVEEAELINEKAYDMYIIEKSVRQREINRKFSSLLNKYNYDPKTKTIEVNGTKIKVNVNREDPYAASTMLQVDMKKYNREVKRLISIGMNEKDAKHIASSLLKRSGNTKIKSISIGNQINEFGLLHEVGHVKDESNKRKIKREKQFIDKYGRSSLNKDTRKELLKDDFFDDRDNNKIQKDIEKAVDEKNDKDQKRVINYKKINDAIKYQNLKQLYADKTLNEHDRSNSEYIADLYAMTHQDEHEFTDENKKHLDKVANSSDQKFFRRPMKVFSNPDNENRQISRNELMKRERKLITDTFK